MTSPRARPALADRGGIARGAVGLAFALAALITLAPPAGAQSVPGAVEGLHAFGLANHIVLRWDAPTSDGGSPVTGYRYRHRAWSDGTAGDWSDYSALGFCRTCRRVTITGFDASTTDDIERRR